jgi:multiple antibiotic resistance protein
MFVKSRCESMSRRSRISALTHFPWQPVDGTLSSMAVSFFIKALVALFTVVDPIGQVPLVLALTAGMPPAKRRHGITRAVLIAGGVIAVFGIFGHAIFDYLGVTSPAFSIAGGALLFLIAIDMLFGRPSGAKETAREAQDALSRPEENSVFTFPLAIPMIAGPGTITTVILLVDDAGGDMLSLLIIAVATVLTLLACWIAMRVSVRIQQLVGTSGILVLSRVLGMLLAAVAVQFILNGLAAFVAQR